MAIGDIGHWQDNAGSQMPSTSWAGLNFASQQRLDNSNYSKTNDSTIKLASAGNYLIVATVRYGGGSNRMTPQGRLSLTTGSGSLFTTYTSGYMRDSSETDAWFKVYGVYHGGSANDEIQIQHRRDSNSSGTGTIVNTSDIQIVQLDYSNIGIYTDTSGGATLGGTSPNTLALNNSVVETDSDAISRSGNTITIKNDNKNYLLIWGIGGVGGSSNNRTQRLGQLNYDGSSHLETRNYTYIRNSANNTTGMSSVDVIKTGTSNRTIKMECFRGVGVNADEGGALSDGDWQTSANQSGIVVIELNDGTDIFRSHDSTGVQSVNVAGTLNGLRDVDISSTTLTKSSNTELNCDSASDLFVSANLWLPRHNVGATARFTGYATVKVNGSETTVGRHGSYTRGNEGSTDAFGMAYNPSGIYTTSSDDEKISITFDKLSGTENGGDPRTQPNGVNFVAINLDTLSGSTNVIINADNIELPITVLQATVVKYAVSTGLYKTSGIVGVINSKGFETTVYLVKDE